MTDNTKRFSDRVKNYIRYRPGYPPQLLPFFRETLQLRPNARMADIGSGTGKLAEPFLNAGYAVTGVEPNEEMRIAGENLLAVFDHFTSVNGTAEHTTLPDDSFDFVLAGQAFHWFDPQRARREFQRIKSEEGWVVLIWNERNTHSPFLAEYERFLHDYANQYADVNHRHIDKVVFDDFFGDGRYDMRTFANEQTFDFAGLVGRYLSSSYAYTETHPCYGDAIRQLSQLFDAHQQNGRVWFEYQTMLYYGRLI